MRRFWEVWTAYSSGEIARIQEQLEQGSLDDDGLVPYSLYFVWKVHFQFWTVKYGTNYRNQEGTRWPNSSAPKFESPHKDHYLFNLLHSDFEDDDVGLRRHHNCYLLPP